MSSKGNNNNSTNNDSNASSTPTAATAEATVISGWEHSTYANAGTSYANERYVYIGKDETTGEPEWIDHGPKGGR